MPSDPQDYTLFIAVRDALQRANGSGVYHNDLSSAVVVGTFEPHSPPRGSGACVAVSMLELEQTESDVLTGHTSTFTVGIQAWTPTADGAAARLLALSKLSSDIRRSLWSAVHDSATALHGVLLPQPLRQVYADAATQNSLGERGYTAFALQLSYEINLSELE